MSASGEHIADSTAVALLDEFGCLGAILTAHPDRLIRVAGGDFRIVAALARFRATMAHVLLGELREKPILSTLDRLLDYLRFVMAFDTIERIRVIHLNGRNVLIRDEVVSEGTIDEAQLHVREVIRRAIDLGSAALIIVHNHPSGDPEPSRADIEITRKLANAGKAMGIALHDHLIFAKHGHSSFRALGLL